MTFDLHRWTSFAVPGDTSVWLCPDCPTWFVPTTSGERLLRDMQAGSMDRSPSVLSFRERLPDPPSQTYPGRRALLSDPPQLQELWLHITDRCNLSCSHCLFSSGPDSSRELSLEQLISHCDTAAAMGCRLFALTGGEPLAHPDFQPLIKHLLAIPGSRIVILTNGLLAGDKLAEQWPRERISLQVSLDGRPSHHDHLRGAGTFDRLEQQLVNLRRNGWNVTFSCCVTRENADDLAWMVEYASSHGARAVHFMWHFIRGRATGEQHLPPLELLPPLLAAMERAEELGISIDNIENLKAQIFSPPGTIHDGSSAGWETAAIGPDNCLYPSAATIGFTELATPLDEGVGTAWRQSPVLASIREASVVQLEDPWRFLLGGGDFDHSWHHAGAFMGCDPYQPLMEQLALHLISRAAGRLPESVVPGLRLKMGELLVSCGSHGPVAFCHTNCLLSLDGSVDSRSRIGNYYADAVGDTNSTILNPVHYETAMMEHIPAAYRFRGYGCGSPVLDAELQPGERMVDLGCGSGVECFIAARMVGSSGEVIGIDMLDPMLELARKGAEEVRCSLGFDNLSFLKGYLEELPLADNHVDLVVSNCVLNLSTDKRATFAEILRALKPGGRLVAADVVCETEPDADILNDETLRGECISGALTQKDLLGILEETGFSGFRVLKRLPYRVVGGHPFFSLTFVALKPSIPAANDVRVFYPGPAHGLMTNSGHWLRPGQTTLIPRADAELLGDQVWQLDEFGFATNVTIAAGANCCLPPEQRQESPVITEPRHDSGCLVCGAPLLYHSTEQPVSCHYCGKQSEATARCEQGHFVCDRCHTGDALQVIEEHCRQAVDTDPIELFQRIRRHPSVPLHGPQHHAMVPGVLLACLRSAGLDVTDMQLHAAIQRGGEVSGGSCGFMGVCGAATGTGIAFSVLLEATPLKATARQSVQQVVQRVLAEIADHEAARCCQRDCWIALQSGMSMAAEMWELDIPQLSPFACSQVARNKECLGVSCPLWP